MSDVELVRKRCGLLERLLKENYGATGRGLGDLAYSVENQISPKVFKNIKYIGWERNEIMHDVRDTLKDRDRFIRACDMVEQELQAGTYHVNSPPLNSPPPAYHSAAPNTSTVSRTRQHQPISQSPPLVILFSWMFAHFLGTILGVLGILVAGGIMKFTNIFSALEPIRNLYMTVNIVLILLIPFLALGFRQQKFMQRFPFEHSSGWARATVLGGMLVTAITLLLMINSNYQGAQQFILTLPTVLQPGSYMFLGTVMGLSAGVFQFFLLRKSTTKARWWLVASGLQGMVMYGLWQYFTDLLKGFGNVIWFLLAPSLSSLVTGVALLYLAKSLVYRRQPLLPE